MARDLDPKCKKCRREGEKLFLKGEKCLSPKCPIIKRNYPPGLHGSKRRIRHSPYGLQLREKQKARISYRILETQFKNYFLKAQKRKGNTGEFFIQLLEMRLDNTIYRMGFAKSRDQARQFISHGLVLINSKRVTLPSFQVKIGDKINVTDKGAKLTILKEISKSTHKTGASDWIKVDAKKLEGEIVSLPKTEDLKLTLNLPLIIEYYSR